MTDLAEVLRRATDDDAEALAAFAAAVFPLGGRRDADPADIAAFIATGLTPERVRELISDPETVVLIAEENNRIAGYAALVRNHSHSQIGGVSPAEVRKFYVDPTQHGKGLANRLMHEILAGVGQECEVVWLSVFSENSRAIAFYQRWGFQICGSQKFLVGTDAQSDLLMRLDVRKESKK